MPHTTPTRDLPQLLHRVFGHSEFRPHQQSVCEATTDGRDVLLVMPTGAGKSLCYQLPALARGGTALVISPLIALMDDQASKLSALGLNVARIHSGLSREDSRQACRDYLDGALDFLFIAPERMRVPGFPEMLAKRKPTLVAIDEAHCISQWGHDFRPDYRTLGQYLPALRPAPILALTATATPTVQHDIAKQLNLQDPGIFITGFRRHNLAVEVVELSKPQRADFALKLLKPDTARPAILYAASRKQAEELAGTLHKHFPTAAYHAGLDPGTRDRVQRAFLGGKLDVVVATVAFGMGVDKADVRTVIHVALPGSVEAYYQEIGRAGRDGKPSRTVLLHGFADRRLQEFFLEKNYPPTGDLERVAAILPHEFTPIDVLHNALRKKKDMMDRETLERSIEKLLASGVAVMDIEGNVRTNLESSGAPFVTASPSRVGSQDAGPTWQSVYESQVAIRRAQIDRMIAFAESNECRMRALVQHFGDSSDTAQTCGLCDICNPSGDSANAAHQPTDEERRWLRQILSALDNRSTSTGKLFTDLRLTRERADFDTLLEGLARAGLITITNDTFRTPEGIDRTYKKAAITHEGRDPDDATLNTVWIRGTISSGKKSSTKFRSRTTSNLSSRPERGAAERPASKEPQELSPTAEALFQKLRDWRTEVARPTKTPAFMILGDAVLRALAHHTPANLVALHQINGMGPTKVDRYGASILAVIRGEATTPGALPSSAPKSSKPTTTANSRQGGVAQSQSQPSRPSTNLSSRPERSEVERPASTQAPARSSGLNPNHPIVQAIRVTPKPTPPPTNIPFTESQRAIEQRLIDWRNQQAKTAGLPSFFILSDTAVRNIVAAAPRSLDDMRNLQGLGTEKLAQHGPAILQLCNA